MNQQTKILTLRDKLNQASVKLDSLQFELNSVNFQAKKHKSLMEALMQFHRWLDKRDASEEIKGTFADILRSHL